MEYSDSVSDIYETTSMARKPPPGPTKSILEGARLERAPPAGAEEKANPPLPQYLLPATRRPTSSTNPYKVKPYLTMEDVCLDPNQNIEPPDPYDFRQTLSNSSFLRKLDVDCLLMDCNSYINWSGTHLIPLSDDMWKREIDLILRRFVLPNERFEGENLSKYDSLEHISLLGSLCYCYIELSDFQEAAAVIERTREFVVPCIRNKHLPIEFIDSFDYVWVFLRLYASVKEWEKTGAMFLFPQIDLANVPKSFENLSPKVKAGICGLKYYYFKLQKVSEACQIEVLRKAVSYHRFYFEWHLCLQQHHRTKRKGIPFVSEVFRHFNWDEEISLLALAGKLYQNHPRCMLATIQLLADMAKFYESRSQKWTILKFGDLKFHSMIQIKYYIQEQTGKILALCTKSLKTLLTIAEIYSTGLPVEHRNHHVAKQYIETAIADFPDAVEARYRLGIFYLTVEFNYMLAENYFREAYKVDNNFFPALISLIQIMMRKKLNAFTILELIRDALSEPLNWDRKQLGSLHFFRGLLLLICEDSCTKMRAALGEFLKAVGYHEKSLAFQELPNLHKRNGWPDWDSEDTKLSYDKILLKMARAAHGWNMAPEKKLTVSKIIQSLELSLAADTKSRNKWQR